MGPGDRYAEGNRFQRTLAALGWGGATQSTAQALQLATSIVLARLLGPHEFGLVGMLTVFTGFASILADLSLGTALIQRRNLSMRHLNSAFWINIAVALGLTLVFAAAAPLVASFYDEPRLRALTVAASLNFVFTAVAIVPMALLDRALDFRTKFRVEVVAAIGGSIVGLFVARFGGGAWSLIVQTLAYSVGRNIMIWSASRWRPTWGIDAMAARELFAFSSRLAALSVIGYWGRNADRLLIGRTLGSVPLGLYSGAFRLVSLPLETMTNVTNSVMFPTFSGIQDDRDQLREGYLRSTRVIALLAFPALIGFAALARPAVLTMLGEPWRASINPIRLLALSAVAQSVYNTATWVILSMGRTDLSFWLGVYAMAVRVAGAAIGLRWGVTGVAAAYFVGSWCLLWYPVWRSVARLLGVPSRVLLRNVTGPLLCALAMGAAVGLVDYGLTLHSKPSVGLATGLALGIMLYLFLVRVFRLQALSELQGIVRAVLKV